MKSDIPMDFTEYLCYSGKGPFNEITAISEDLRGFLNCKPMDLKFNRRAREPILIDTLETCFHIAGGHRTRVVAFLPPTSRAGVGFLAWPQVGKLVVAYRWSAV